MGKTYRKIGKKDGKKELPVRSPKHAEAHGITIPHNCRCDGCTGKRKEKKATRVAKKDIKSALEDYLDYADSE